MQAQLNRAEVPQTLVSLADLSMLDALRIQERARSVMAKCV